jgi:hypothetical protein
MASFDENGLAYCPELLLGIHGVAGCNLAQSTVISDTTLSFDLPVSDKLNLCLVATQESTGLNLPRIRELEFCLVAADSSASGGEKRAHE